MPPLRSSREGTCGRAHPEATVVRPDNARTEGTARALSAALGMAPGRFRFFVRTHVPELADRIRFTPGEVQRVLSAYHTHRQGIEDLMAEAQKLTTKEVSEALGTDPKRLRVFLRSDASPMEAVGAGNRYQFTKKDLPKLKKAFENWAKDDEKRKADRKARLEAERAKAAEESTPADEDLPDPDNVAGEIGPADDAPAPRELDMTDEAATA